ncbi:MAG TPA: hypothetical protein VK814_00065 [Acidobacteriaceae bacterium]|jgi:hypothetical protein|nr:hypothetical protein [Acidobacteriaceae bacterium]
MENDFAPPDPPQQSPPAPTRDPLIRYSVFAALGCAAVCMIFTILYVFSYSLDSTLSFERHFDSYLAPGNAGNLSTVLGLHMAQNRMFLQSCGMVSGIFFAFLGLALFLLGIQGTLDADGQVKDYSASARRLAPGGVILLASMIFVGISAMHPVDFVLGPIAPAATFVEPTSTAPPGSAPAAPTQSAPATTQSPSPTSAPSTQSQVQPRPAVPQTARLVPQSAQNPATTQALLSAKPLMAAQPAGQSPIPPAQRPATRPAPVKQAAATPPPAHRFQP